MEWGPHVHALQQPLCPSLALLSAAGSCMCVLLLSLLLSTRAGSKTTVSTSLFSAQV